MKKLLLILIVSFLALFLFSCKQNVDINEDDPNPIVDKEDEKEPDNPGGQTDPIEDPNGNTDEPDPIEDEPVVDDPVVDPVEEIVISLSVESDGEFYVGQTMNLIVGVTPVGEYQLKYSVSNPSVISLDGLTITALQTGTSKITCELEDGSKSASIEVTVVRDKIDPEFVWEDGYSKDMTISYNDSFDPRAGFKIIDNVDGDITDRLEIEGTVNNRKVGTHTLKYTVRDSAKNRTVIERVITVVWDYSVQFIGHAGCYSGLMNSAEAFCNAYLLHHYQAIECDVKQTKDGVFVTSHDDTFNGKTIASYTWEELKKEIYTATRGGISYSTNLCTFEEYLRICKEGKVKAVVELKSSSGITNNDQSRMQALMDVIKKCGMLNDVIFLGSQYNCLIWTRNNGYDYIPCQYLVNSCESETYLQRCIDNKLDISFNIEYSNSQEWIDRYHEAGCLVSCWTFSQYTTVKDLQTWIDKGVDFVTVDVTKPYQVNLPKKTNEEGNKYTVTFKDYDGTIIKTSTVLEGKSAVTPLDPKRNGYVFSGWEPSDLKNITSDLEVLATYTIEEYTITYVANINKVTESSWENKDAFVKEFYEDLFTWITKNVSKMPRVNFDGTKYYTTSNVSQGDATFTNATELLDMNLYTFEASISAHMYKPIDGTNSKDYIPLEDDDYFLNTEPYRTKYQGMNAYLLNCMEKQYSSYSYTYKQASNNRVQIFFRFHQWCKGTNIPPFDDIPKKYIVDVNNVEVVLPTTPLTYTILDEIVLKEATADGKKFKGWATEPSGKTLINKIEKGTYGNLVLYAIWE